MKHHLLVMSSQECCKTPPSQFILERFIWLLLIIGLVSGTNSVWGQCFNPAINYPTTNDPTSAAVGDFNGDGLLDLVCSIENNRDQLEVHLANETGGFASSQSYELQTYVYSVAIGDLNLDGKLDIAAACYNTGSVAILLGDGQGRFSTPTFFDAAKLALNSIAIADINNDGKPDLVTIDYLDNRALFLLGDGWGGFGQKTSINFDDPQSLARSVTTGDFNGDGNVDLAILYFNSIWVSIYLGNGSGGFGVATKYFVGTAPSSVAAADFNGDGKLDLAVSLYFANSISMLLGNGSGTFKTPTLIALGRPVTALSASDLNADGKPDLVMAANRYYSVAKLINCTGVSNTAPEAVANPPQLATLGTSFSYTVNAFSDKETPNNLTYSAHIDPTNGLSFNTATRVISGTPITSTTSNVTITATDSGGLSASTSFSITASPASTTGLSITGVTGVSCLTLSASERQLIFTPYYSGQKAEPISFWVANEMMPTTAPGPYSLQLYTDNPTITLMAQQGGAPVSYRYDWLASCGTTPLPPTGFAITGVTPVSCQALSGSEHLVRFTPQYRSQSSEPISFSVVNELMATTAAGPYSLRTYADNPVVTLWAQQGNESATYRYNWLVGCNGGARKGSESSDSFRVVVLGNPVTDQLEVEVRGAGQQSLSLQVFSEQGQRLSQLHLQQAGAVERHWLKLGSQAGVYLLDVSTPTQRKTLKVVKQ